jgi:MFS superfamily sulfate permease-like transporter
MSMKQPLRWRIFAICILAMVLPFEFGGLFKNPAPYDAVRFLMDTTASIGLTGYAFGRPLGQARFWRCFSAAFLLFCIFIVVSGVARMARLAAVLPRSVIVSAALATTLALGLAITYFTVLGLLRHGGWLRGTPPQCVDLDATFR